MTASSRRIWQLSIYSRPRRRWHTRLTGTSRTAESTHVCMYIRCKKEKKSLISRLPLVLSSFDTHSRSVSPSPRCHTPHSRTRLPVRARLRILTQLRYGGISRNLAWNFPFFIDAKNRVDALPLFLRQKMFGIIRCHAEDGASIDSQVKLYNCTKVLIFIYNEIFSINQIY